MLFVPYDQDNSYIWLNGNLINLPDAKIHVLSHSLHYSGAVFEGEKAYNSKVFKLREHTERLLSGAQKMHLNVPYSIQDIMEAHELLIEKNKIKDAYIRPLVFRSNETLGLTNGPLITSVMIATVTQFKKSGEPFRLNVSRWRKIAPEALDPQIKSSGHYNMAIVAQLEAKEAGFNDSILLDWRGFIAECTTTNIFFIHNNTLITPIADAFLNGITRQTFISIAKELGIVVREEYIKLEDIENCHECFLTGSAIEIKEVSYIDLGNRKKINFSENKITKILKEKFMNIVQNL